MSGPPNRGGKNGAEASPIIAVCDSHGPDATRMSAFLQAQGLNARWFASRDLDDVDAEASAGRTTTVVLICWQQLLDGIWNGEVDYPRWLAAGTQVLFVDSPGDDAAACLATLSQAWDRYRATQRRRSAAAGLVLSIIVILAAFTTLWCSHA